MKIAIIAGGTADEHEVSLSSAAKVQSALSDQDTVSVVIGRDLKTWGVDDESMEPTAALECLKQEVDVALLVLHGPFGEDGTIQGALETAGIPYTGSDVAASALAMDKFAANFIAERHGLYIPTTMAIDQQRPVDLPDMSFPVILKPRYGGSTVGVTVCNDQQELKTAITNSSYRKLIVQELINGREYTCGVIQSSVGDIQPLPLTEVIHDGLFDYDAKYSQDSPAQELTPAPNTTNKQRKLIKSAAITAHTALGCKGISRTDFMLSDNGKLYFIETNTSPGMTGRSFIPAQIEAAGLDLAEVLLDQCKLGVNR